MNKKEFSEALSKIIKRYPKGKEITGRDKDFIIESLSKTKRYCSLSGLLHMGYQEITNGRRVKMIFLGSIPISKSSLIESLYPTKSRMTGVQKHRGKVITAMRNMVQYQLREYRESLNLPVICWRTGERIWRGDIDHIGDPFIKIVDDFLESQSLSFSEVCLRGPVNNKVFKDQVLEESWKSFHKERATLALVSSSENRSAGSGGYQPK